MATKHAVIINPNSRLFEKRKDFLSEHDVSVIGFPYDLEQIITNKIKQKYTSFIICGGDGTINCFIHIYMRLPERVRSRLKIGLVPCGTANDLARQMNIPLDFNKAYDIIKSGRKKRIDLIRVNDRYFVTWGGAGIAAKVIKDVNKMSTLVVGRISKLFRHFFYFISICIRVIFGYGYVENIRINGRSIGEDKFMGLTVHNQSRMAMVFSIFPGARNDDGRFEILVVKNKNRFTNMAVFIELVKHHRINLQNAISLREKEATITFKKKRYFMGDGELLLKSKTFNIQAVPKALAIYCPKGDHK